MSGQQTKRTAVGRALAALLVLGLAGCTERGTMTTEAGGEHDAQASDAKGPHGGRLLVDGDFAIEIAIFERGVPEFRAYPYDSDQPAPLSDIRLAIDLHRFGGRVDHIEFVPRNDYLVGDKTVEEPHSFDVVVTARYRGGEHRWQYASYEGRTELSPAAIASSGITIATAGPATIRTVVEAHGRLVPNEDRLAHVIPRFPGVVKEVRRRLGNHVTQGETLAVVQSNESLQTYEVPSPISGTIIAKHATTGELAREGDVIYTVADLSTVWGDLNVVAEDFRRLRLGQTATLESTGGIPEAQGPIVYLSPLGAENTQMLLARVEIANPNGDWKPGLYVSAEIVVEQAQIPIAVETKALQTFRDWDVVFLTDGKVFQAMPLELGRRDDTHAEVLSGVAAGERYAADNSFIVKADVGKSGASHDH